MEKKPKYLSDLPPDQIVASLRWAEETFGPTSGTAIAYLSALLTVRRRQRFREQRERKAKGPSSSGHRGEVACAA